MQRLRSNLNMLIFQTGVCNRIVMRVMRNARPFLLVALYLTAFAGYFFNVKLVCSSFVIFSTLLFDNVSVLIAYCVILGACATPTTSAACVRVLYEYIYWLRWCIIKFYAGSVPL